MFRGVVRIQPAVIALFVVVLFGVWGQAQAGPITNGPGVAPFVKLGVYQGVISIVPGGLTDSIMEIGNAGRDIASTGSLYLRPGTLGGQGGNVVITPQGGPSEGGEIAIQGYGAYQTWNIDVWQNRLRVHTAGQERLVFDGTVGNTYLPTGQLCFGNVGSTNCISGAGGPGATPTLDEVLAAGATGDAKQIFLANQGSAAKSFGASSGASLGAGSFAFLMPYSQTNGAYNDVTRANDSGLFFNQAFGLTIGGWNAGGTIKGARFSGGTAASAALAVNNGLAGTGSGGDSFAAYANTTSSAVYAQQNNAAGYAGYFSGRVSVTGNFYLGGRLKPQAIQVCQVGTDTCLGRYYYTTGTVKNPADVNAIKLFYESGSVTANNLGLGVAAFATGPSQPFCDPGETLIQRNDPPAPESVYNVSNCGGTLANEFVNPGSAPYGSPQPLCRTNATTTITILSYRDPFGCSNVNNPGRSVQALSTPTMLPSYNPQYELR